MKLTVLSIDPLGSLLTIKPILNCYIIYINIS